MSRLADKIKKALEEGRSGQFVKKSPYERFGFKQNPFRLDVDLLDPDFQIAREEVLLEFALQVGNAIRLFEEDILAPFRHLLVHGLRGSGKSSLARRFHREWDQYDFQDYTTLYTDLASWQEPVEYQEEFSSSEKTLETYESFLNHIKLIDKPLILFIDNLDYTITGTAAIPGITRFIRDIEESSLHGVILIGFIRSLTLAELQDSDNKIRTREFLSFFNPDYFFFPIFSKAEIRRLIIQRLKVARTPTDIFSAKAIDLIADHSLGLPTVALKLATASLNDLIIRNEEGKDSNKVTFSIVTSVIGQFGYDTTVKLVESIDHDSVEELSEKIQSLITPKRREIIAEIFNHQIQEQFHYLPTGIGLRSSDLAERFAVNLSTMNYHIKPLITASPISLLEAKDNIHDTRSRIFLINWDSHISYALEILTVFHRLQKRQYHIHPKTILLSRRAES